MAYPRQKKEGSLSNVFFFFGPFAFLFEGRGGGKRPRSPGPSPGFATDSIEKCLPGYAKPHDGVGADYTDFGSVEKV